MINILLTSAGRRGYLVEYFVDALAGRGRVIAANSDTSAPALAAADQIAILPYADDPGFADALVACCQKYEIDLIFSLHDWEAPAIARLKSRLMKEAGTLAVVPDPEICHLCLDKLEMFEWALAQGIESPRVWTDPAVAIAEYKGPYIVKGRYGQGSLGLIKVDSPALLPAAWDLVGEQLRAASAPLVDGVDDIGAPLICEFIEGTEYGIDILNDFEGNHIATLVKEKCGMRAGETDIAVSRDLPEISAFGARIGSALGHPGQCDADVIVRDGIPFLIECNPRFGGHYPFSHHAGANIPKYLIDLYENGQGDPADLEMAPDIAHMKTIGFARINS